MRRLKKHDTKTVVQLIPVSDPKANSSYALTYAVELGYIDLYHLLLPHCHPEHNYGETLLAAVRIGNLDIVQQLFDLSNNTLSCTLAFQLAIKLGNEDLVRFFLPKVDPKLDNSISLQYAVEKGDKHIEGSKDADDPLGKNKADGVMFALGQIWIISSHCKRLSQQRQGTKTDKVTFLLFQSSEAC